MDSAYAESSSFAGQASRQKRQWADLGSALSSLLGPGVSPVGVSDDKAHVAHQGALNGLRASRVVQLWQDSLPPAPVQQQGLFCHYCNCVAISCYHSPLTIWALGPV